VKNNLFSKPSQVPLLAFSTLRFSGYDYVLSGYETATLKRMGLKNQNKRKRRGRDHSK